MCACVCVCVRVCVCVCACVCACVCWCIPWDQLSHWDGRVLAEVVRDKLLILCDARPGLLGGSAQTLRGTHMYQYSILLMPK